jgi:hypothetical protein
MIGNCYLCHDTEHFTHPGLYAAVRYADLFKATFEVASRHCFAASVITTTSQLVVLSLFL